MKIGPTCVTVLGLMACGHFDEGSEAEQTEDAIMAETRVLWTDPSNIPVCWEPAAAGAPTFDTEKEWARVAVTSAWTGANPRIQFRGWKTCDQKDRGIRIKIAADASGPRTENLGSKIDGMNSGMVLSFDLAAQQAVDPLFKDFLAPCTESPEARRTCLEYIAVHEFGHALGLRHEQDRSDVPTPCDREQYFSRAAGVVIGPYDDDSVMNYCKPRRLLGGSQLSELDKEGILALYNAGPPAAGTRLDSGRPVVVFSSLINGAGSSDVVMGRESRVTLWYPNLTDPNSVPVPGNALSIEDASKNAPLKAGPWTATDEGLTSSAKWTPTVGPTRVVVALWDGRLASAFRLVPAIAEIKNVSAKLGSTMTATLEAVSQPGAAVDEIRVGAFFRASNKPVELATRCSPSPTGKTCVSTSTRPLNEKGPMAILVSATALGERSSTGYLVDVSP